MPYPPRNAEQDQEFFPITFRHETLTANTSFKAWKVPAGRRFRIDRILYNNPTGLVEDNANNFTLELKNSKTSLADATFTVANATDTATITAHGMTTGDGPFRVVNSGGGLPTGLIAHTNYWMIVTGANTFKFATSRANALAGTVLDLTSDGTGTQTLVRNLITRVFNTDADLTPDIGASLAADSMLEFKTADTEIFSMSRVIEGGDFINAVFTETGTATLPPGFGVIEGRLL